MLDGGAPLCEANTASRLDFCGATVSSPSVALSLGLAAVVHIENDMLTLSVLTCHVFLVNIKNVQLLPALTTTANS